MPALMQPPWRGYCWFWSVDDSGPDGRADLDRHRLHRHEERHAGFVIAGAGRPRPRSVCRRCLRVPWPRRFLDQGAVARWNWFIALRQAAGSRTVRLAGDGGWRGGAECGADELFAGGDRLAQPATYVAATERGIDVKNVLNGRKKVPQIAGFMIRSAS